MYANKYNKIKNRCVDFLSTSVINMLLFSTSARTNSHRVYRLWDKERDRFFVLQVQIVQHSGINQSQHSVYKITDSQSTHMHMSKQF